MNLNSEIWGTQEDNAVELGSNRNIYYSNKAGASSLGEYRVAYGMSDPIDETVNCWQLADFSMFNSVAFCRRDGNNTPVLDVIRSDKPKSIFLAIAPGASNMTFNPAQSSNLMWSADVSNSVYTGTNYKILPWFNYNEIMVIFQLVTRKFDADGKPTGSNVSRSIYSYYHDNDVDDEPFTTNWKIIGINVRFAHKIAAVDTYQPFGEDVSAVSSADMPFPQPNYYYSSGKYISYNGLRYAGGVNSFGNGSTSSAGGYGYQQGAYGQNNNAYIIGYSSDAWEKRSYLNSSNQLIEYFNCTLDYEGMLRQCSTLGFWFNETIATTSSATSWTNTLGENCTSDNVILPEIVGGRTTGNFKRGRQAGADPQAQWGADWRDNAGYTGDKPYTNDNQNTGDLTSIFNRPVIGGSCNYYNAIGTDIINMTGFINSGYQPATEDQFIVDFKGVNPADYISSILYYPTGFTAGKLTESGTPVEIAIGALSTTGVYMIPADAGSQNIVSFSPISLQQYYHDFRDYAPYTSLDLYVPFCGAVELDPAIYLGHTLQVYLFIDFPTGNCTAAIMCDGLVHDTISGSCGVSVPLTAANIGSYQNAIKSAEIALKQAEMQRKSAWIGLAASTGTLLAGAATGNALMIAGAGAGVLSSALNIGKADLNVRAAEYQLDHIAPSIRSVSAASPANALCLDYDCHLLIKRPFEVPVNDSVYSETIGNACCITDVLSAFHGLTVCNSVYISDIISDYISIDDNTYGGNAATAQEMALIQQSLSNGVYLP